MFGLGKLIFLFLFSFLFLNACTPTSRQIILPKSKVKPSEFFVEKNALQIPGANFFNEIEEFDRMLAAKNRGITWIRLTPSKWQSSKFPEQKGAFLIGDANNYQGLIKEDAQRLTSVLDYAHKAGLKVVLTFLNVPGRIWRQHQASKNPSAPIWLKNEAQNQALDFFHDVALYFGDHPALLALNPINEPAPEKYGIRFKDHDNGDYLAWYKKIENTTQDLNSFYKRVVQKIRRVRAKLPIVLDSGNFAHPKAFSILKPIDDPDVYYSFHWYVPFNISQKNHELKYPGNFLISEENPEEKYVDKNYLQEMLEPVLAWQRMHNISSDRIMVGEFGANRQISGADRYLKDCRELFLNQNFLHAFYGFREYGFARMDYELGDKSAKELYRQAVEKKVTPIYQHFDSEKFIDALGLKKLFVRSTPRALLVQDANQDDILRVSDYLQKNNFLEHEFDTIILGRGFYKNNLALNGDLEVNQNYFPSGIKDLAEKLHESGLKLGLRIPMGTNSCDELSEGTLSFEEKNARAFNQMGIDFLMLDACLLDKSKQWDEEILYATLHDWQKYLDPQIKIIAHTKQHAFWFNRLVNFSQTSGGFGTTTKFSTEYLRKHPSLLDAVRNNSRYFLLEKENFFQYPGLISRLQDREATEIQSQLNMWAMINAPFFVEIDHEKIDKLPNYLKDEILLNAHKKGIEQGRLVFDQEGIMIFRKHLINSSVAVLVVNTTSKFLRKNISFNELDVLATKNIRSAFSKKINTTKKGLKFDLKPKESHLIVFDYSQAK